MYSVFLKYLVALILTFNNIVGTYSISPHSMKQVERHAICKCC